MNHLNLAKLKEVFFNCPKLKVMLAVFIMLFILLGICVIALMFSVSDKEPKSIEDGITPEQFGWKNCREFNYWKSWEQGNYTLSYDASRTQNHWTFDTRKKKAPGVIARFDQPLLEADLEYMDVYMKNRTTRIRS